MLKELCCTAMLLTAGANLYAQEPQSIEKSQTIVYINGAKYYVHNVRHGETLYSLAKTYGVAEQMNARTDIIRKDLRNSMYLPALV